MKKFVVEYEGCPFEELILAEDEYEAYQKAEEPFHDADWLWRFDPRELYVEPLEEWEAINGKWEA